MSIAEGNKPLVRQTKQAFEDAVTVLGMANSNILSLTTVKGTNTTTSLVAMIGALPCAEAYVPLKRQIQDAMIVALNVGVFGADETAANVAVAAANTLNGMRALWNTADSTLSATARDYPSASFPVGHPQTL